MNCTVLDSFATGFWAGPSKKTKAAMVCKKVLVYNFFKIRLYRIQLHTQAKTSRLEAILFCEGSRPTFKLQMTYCSIDQ